MEEYCRGSVLVSRCLLVFSSLPVRSVEWHHASPLTVHDDTSTRTVSPTKAGSSRSVSGHVNEMVDEDFARLVAVDLESER
jgi:hypothetical protein